jgi:hypothetical protein
MIPPDAQRYGARGGAVVTGPVNVMTAMPNSGAPIAASNSRRSGSRIRRTRQTTIARRLSSSP